MERIRVAQVVTRFIAGAGGVALRGALNLDPERYEVTVISAPGGRLLGIAEQAGIRVTRLRHMAPDISPREDLNGLKELTQIIGEGRYQVVHTHSSKAGALGRIAAHRLNVPAIVHTFHGFPFHDFQSPVRRCVYVAIERALGRITHRFLAVGRAVEAEAIRLKLAPLERIRVVAPAIDTSGPSATDRTRRRARSALGLPMDARVVGTVGRVDYQKAPEALIEAVASLHRRDLYTVWVGDGPLREQMQLRVTQQGLGEQFLFLGERADVLKLLPAFDVFALASRYEGLPCAIAEAMSCGIPVVATAVNAVPEVVIPGETGLLVPPADPGRLAVAIEYMLDHRPEARRMAATARRDLGNRFDPRLLGRVLMQIYEDALGFPHDTSIGSRPPFDGDQGPDATVRGSQARAS